MFIRCSIPYLSAHGDSEQHAEIDEQDWGIYRDVEEAEIADEWLATVARRWVVEVKAERTGTASLQDQRG